MLLVNQYVRCKVYNSTQSAITKIMSEVTPI